MMTVSAEAMVGATTASAQSAANAKEIFFITKSSSFKRKMNLWRMMTFLPYRP
jgi:hypothetical protein